MRVKGGTVTHARRKKLLKREDIQIGRDILWNLIYLSDLL